MSYECHNQPRPTRESTHPAQVGWNYKTSFTLITRTPDIRMIPHTMTTECQYTKTNVDAQCDGCQHKQEVKE